MNHPRRPPHLPYPPYPRGSLGHILIAILLLAIPSASAQTRLADASDRTAFRSWFTLLADLHSINQLAK
jgi:hypothetical protein